MRFKYTAMNADQVRITGEIEAADTRSATRQLRAQGFVPIALSSRENGRSPGTGSAIRRKPKATDIRLALEQLTTLLASGVSLDEAVDSLANSSQSGALAQVFDGIATQIRRGDGFSQALAASSLKLPEYVYQLAEAGELTGKLAESLKSAVEQMAYEEELAAEFRNAMIYPAVLIFSGIGAVLLIFALVVPQFSNLLDRSGDLPALAWLVLSAGRYINENGMFVGGLVLLSAMLAAAALRKKEIRQQLWDAAARLPLVGPWLLESDIARWSSLAATLLGSRVELLPALDLAARTVKTGWMRARLEQASRKVRGGESLEKALGETGAINATGLDLIRVGERSGELVVMLHSLSNLYAQSGRRRMKAVLALLEPGAILIIGGVIGTIMTGIILAITSLNDLAI